MQMAKPSPNRNARHRHHSSGKMKLLLTLILGAACGLSWSAQTTVTVALGPAHTVVCEQTRGFHDGDTFACVPTRASGVAHAFVVRVAGLDAPETGQAHWRPARDRLRDLAGPGSRVSCYKEDRYHRAVCRVRTANGVDVVATLLQEGLAWHSVRYAHEQTTEEHERYAAAEREARAKQLGLWQEPNPQSPWECRRARLQHTSCR